MAEDAASRTEAPSPRRLDEADERGQVAFSGELTQSVLLLMGLVLLAGCGAPLVLALQRCLRETLARPLRAELDARTTATVVAQAMQGIAPAALPILLGLVVVGAGIGFSQVGFRLRPKVIELNFERLDPIAGVKRLFSLRATLRLLVAMAKLAAIAAILWATRGDALERAATLARAPLREAVTTALELALSLMLRVGIAMLLVGCADLAYQRWQHVRDLRMSKEEVKEEMRQTLGDPAVKARIRSAQRLAAQRRMLHDVKKATVVVTNPTHFAVAIRYRRPGGLEPADDAPIVVAKGQDLMARRIREVAAEHGVPLVENPPLARSLHRSVDVGAAIPPELYRAVAEVLAFVFRLRGARAARN
ncbi:MAG TPA: flagellar type III secretion system protein FlhB [Planctomycetota bacterium]|nr:flagellar type III secretion system protein FlhB [Planctomycetota bacterium]